MKITDNEINKIIDLSQNYGMTDTEIARLIGCSRATINRARQKYSIPIRNIKNKIDKKYICIECKKEVYIRRSDSRKLLCSVCLDKLNVS